MTLKRSKYVWMWSVFFLLSSCCSLRQQEEDVYASSAREASAHHERDSVVYIVRDSTVVRHQRDTIVIERIRDRWRDRLVTRTDTVVRTDTLRSAIVQRVEVPAPRSWWARFVAGVGYAALVAGAVWLFARRR